MDEIQNYLSRIKESENRLLTIDGIAKHGYLADGNWGIALSLCRVVLEQQKRIDALEKLLGAK